MLHWWDTYFIKWSRVATQPYIRNKFLGEASRIASKQLFNKPIFLRFKLFSLKLECTCMPYSFPFVRGWIICHGVSVTMTIYLHLNDIFFHHWHCLLLVVAVFYVDDNNKKKYLQFLNKLQQINLRCSRSHGITPPSSPFCSAFYTKALV